MRFYEVADSKADLDSLNLDSKPFLDSELLNLESKLLVDSEFTLDFTLGLPLGILRFEMRNRGCVDWRQGSYLSGSDRRRQSNSPIYRSKLNANYLATEKYSCQYFVSLLYSTSCFLLLPFMTSFCLCSPEHPPKATEPTATTALPSAAVLTNDLRALRVFVSCAPDITTSFVRFALGYSHANLCFKDLRGNTRT